MESTAKIFVAGHRGLVGSAIVRRLRKAGYDNLLLADRSQLDLTGQTAVADFFAAEKPQYVFDAAARVGGIHANATYTADFIRDNLLIQNNLIDSAQKNGVTKFVFLGSSCIYPREAPQPMREDCLLTGPLEATNEWYAIAKIAGIKMCQAYRQQYGFNAISLMPTNLYGPGDNFDLDSSHVIPALMRKFHEARTAEPNEVTVWGTGSAFREFLHVDDLAAACLFLMEHYDGESHINVGTGEDLSIRELAETIRDVVNPDAELVWDTDKPDGTPRKLLDVSRLRGLGWSPSIELRDGLASTYRWYLDQIADDAELRGVAVAGAR